MAKKEVKLPQNVQLLQRRFNDAQTTFNQQFQQRMLEYTGEVSAFESRIEDYQTKAQAYMDDYNQYTQYLNSFFIKPGTTNVETFVKYGDNYYWADDIAPGFNLKAIDNLAALSGGEFQFVKTGTQQHAYTYQSYEIVPKTRWVTESYTAYEMQLKPVTKYESVYVAPDIFAPPGTMGRFEYRMVTKNEFVSTPVTRTRQVQKTDFVGEFVPRSAVENIEIGYLKTQTDEGFTSLRPEQFAIRSEPAKFAEPTPEAPAGLDITDIKGQLEEESAYLKRATGEMSAATREARMRRRVRPLLSEGEAA